MATGNSSRRFSRGQRSKRPPSRHRPWTGPMPTWSVRGCRRLRCRVHQSPASMQRPHTRLQLARTRQPSCLRSKVRETHSRYLAYTTLIQYVREASRQRSEIPIRTNSASQVIAQVAVRIALAGPAESPSVFLWSDGGRLPPKRLIHARLSGSCRRPPNAVILRAPLHGRSFWVRVGTCQWAYVRGRTRCRPAYHTMALSDAPCN